MLNYRDAIGYLYILREHIRKIDTKGLFEYYCPRVRATEEEVLAWESKYHVCLPNSYKNFLMAANGWKCVSQDKDLLSLEELTLLKNDKYIEARDFCINNLKNTGNPDLLLPIAASDFSYDLYLLVLDKKTEYYGQVIWVAGEEIERYKDFDSFFLSLIEYNKYNYELITGTKYQE